MAEQFTDKSIPELLEMLDRAAFNRGIAATSHLGIREQGHSPSVSECTCDTGRSYMQHLWQGEDLVRYLQRIAKDVRK